MSFGFVSDFSDHVNIFEGREPDVASVLSSDPVEVLVSDYLADEFKKDQGIDIRTDNMALQRLTTREPEDDMIEVAIASLEAVLRSEDLGTAQATA